MASAKISGGQPLFGNVKLSGAKNSALKIIPASMFSNEDVILENVPKVNGIIEYTEVLKEMGATAEWIGQNKLLLNGSNLDTYEIPYSFGSEYRVAGLLAVPLIYRFGKAVIPKPQSVLGSLSLSRWVEVWRSLGLKLSVDDKYLRIETSNFAGANINFKVSTHSGTDNAIISSMFAPGETIINNAAEETEVDDLIAFANTIGGNVERIEPRRIKVIGKTVFKGGKYTIMSDKNEAVFFSIAAILTKGNVVIEKVEKTHLTSFINFLTKVGCKYELERESLRVWFDDTILQSQNLSSSPAPGFLTDWLPLMITLLTQAEGESLVHDTIFVNRFDFARELNRMGADIDVLKPSQKGMEPVVSDDSYDLQRFGEPYTLASIKGPTPLRGSDLHADFVHSTSALVAAALGAEGTSTVHNIERLNVVHENLIEKLQTLGAKIELQ